MNKILHNKIINVKDVSDYKNNRLKLSVDYIVDNRKMNKVLVAKIFDNGIVNKESTLYNFLANFKESKNIKEPIIFKGKMNNRILSKIPHNVMNILCYYDEIKEKFNYYDFFISFNKKQIEKMLLFFRKDIGNKVIQSKPEVKVD